MLLESLLLKGLPFCISWGKLTFFCLSAPALVDVPAGELHLALLNWKNPGL